MPGLPFGLDCVTAVGLTTGLKVGDVIGAGAAEVTTGGDAAAGIAGAVAGGGAV